MTAQHSFRTPAAAIAAAFLTLATAGDSAAAEPFRDIAPLQRFIGIGPSGNEVSAYPVAVSAGGAQVAFNVPEGGSSRGHVRDLASGVTTALSAPDTEIVDASDDLGRLLVQTKSSFAPEDTNQLADGYLLDRNTGKITLFTRATTGGPALGRGAGAALISGDGRTIYFSDIALVAQSNGFTQPQAQGPRRYVVETGRVTTFPNKQWLTHAAVDAAGRVLLTDAGILIRDVYSPIAELEGEQRSNPNGVVAQDGSAAAWIRRDESINVILTASRTVRSVKLPQAIADSYLVLQGVTSGGNYLQIGWQPVSEATHRYGVVNTRTGEVTETARITPAATPLTRVVSPDLGYAASHQRMLAVRGGAIPGDDPVIPPAPARQYVTYHGGCRASSLQPWNYPAIRPSLQLNTWTTGSHPRKPVSASITVRVTATGAVASQLSLRPGERKSLYGGFGGTTISGRVTFDDGSIGDFSERVGRYTPPTNAPYPLAPGLNDCTDASL